MFFEVEFPRTISYRSSGGPTWLTTVNEGFSGFEQRNKNWATARGEWTVSLITPESFADSRQTFADLLRAFFLNVSGMGDAFRLFDHTDFSGTAQTIGTGDGANRVFQLQKTYTIGGRSYVKVISKPITSAVKDYQGNSLTDTVKIYRNSILDPASRYTVDHTTGLVTFKNNVSNVSISAASISGINTTYTYTLSSGAALEVGMRIVITGMTNAGNNGTFYITALGAGTFTVVNASGVNASGQTGSGVTDWAPASAVVITSDFQFHYPVRFDTDKLALQVEESDVKNGKPIVSWASITLKEVRILPGSSEG
jgi:uncharacterized protein (TIGR02217 family)